MIIKIEVGVVSGCVLQSVSFLKILDKLSCILTKIAAYIGYLMHGIFNDDKNIIARGLRRS